ncbi:hypothetical protein DID88_004218 [Monilinia fructigena]|uniref:Fatty acid desaturase domain-containing protein n=1 Tax=Monilinia fructigena TaxID=38457 RepID=A0A395IST9_9HELO|nr:hypothetical protein DID88_004218 [Monilinia fructigena]
MERDMVFVPKTREDYANRIGKFVHELHELTEETPIATLIHSIGQQLFGWPLYLFMNVTGHNYHERQPEGRGKGKVNSFWTLSLSFNTPTQLFLTTQARAGTMFVELQQPSTVNLDLLVELFSHGIIETHVLHHYVSTIPFYHADEATEAIKPIMGRHYRADVRGGSLGFLKSLWTSARWCQWVEPSEGAEGEGKKVFFFRNRNGLGTAPLKLKA